MGVVSGRTRRSSGLDGSSTTALMLDNVKVPVENVLGTIGEGPQGRVQHPQPRTREARRAQHRRRQAGARHAAKYAKERRQFGRAIAEFGLIRQKLAEMAIRCFVGDAMVYRALGDVDRALEAVDARRRPAVLKTIEGFAVECSINKVLTSEALAYVVDEALQVFGGNGYSREFPAERAYRDARITRIYEGTNEINRLIIPTRLLKQSPERRQRRTRHVRRSPNTSAVRPAGPAALAERAFARSRQAPGRSRCSGKRPTACGERSQGRTGGARRHRRRRHRGLRRRERAGARGAHGVARRQRAPTSRPTSSGSTPATPPIASRMRRARSCPP